MSKAILYLLFIATVGFYPMYTLVSSGAVSLPELFGMGVIACAGAYITAYLTRQLETGRDYKKYLAVDEKWQARFKPGFKRMAMAAIPLLIGIWIGSLNSDMEKYANTYIMIVVLLLTVEACIGVMMFKPASFLPSFYAIMVPIMTIIINYKFHNSDISLYIIAVLGGFVIWKNNQIKEYMVNN